ncbi:HemY protein [Cricetibacter osteomyelitidis]|uniref:HemY protein n=1 Tax=Cricetibacter osteomyelitidis TaxID=1521931 RepID=A0A4R2THZ0_9PAST|nr:heme biosynthesis protein HemY [Cricetibacter osteomyelitidis]TCP96838.1 HemY protein [Cricetibacter osteomyelitidis]
MLRVLFLMLVLLAGLIGGPYLAGKQGYVLIQTESYNIELSITTLVIFFVLAMAIVYFLEWIVSRFFRLSNNTYSWFSRRKQKKAQKQTLEGLMRMDMGDYSKAEKLIGKNAKHSDEPILNFIKAAEAAQQKGDEFTANKYLIEATELAGSDNLLLEIARTRILLQQHKLPAARSSIDSLLILAPNNQEVLKLAVDIYSKSKAYQTLDGILEKVERSGLYSQTDFVALKHLVENGILDELLNEEGQDGLLAWWKAQPRKRHNDAFVRIGLIQRLIECNDHETASELTEETLKKLTDHQTSELKALFAQIIRLQPSDSYKLIKLLGKREKSIPKELQHDLHRALGYLYARDNQFEKARPFFQTLLEQERIAHGDATMAAYIFEQLGDKVAAQQIRERDLQEVMATLPTNNVSSALESESIDNAEIIAIENKAEKQN